MTHMRIGIDAHMVGTRETGNETYIIGLIEGLERIDPNNRYVLYTPIPGIAKQGLANRSTLHTRLIRPANSWLRIPLSLPVAAWQDSLELLHVTYHAPPVCPCPTIVTIHDVSFRFFPDSFSWRDWLVLSILVPFSAHSARYIITVSENSKRDLIREYRLPPEKIVVTPEAARIPFQPDIARTTLDSIRARYCLHKPYILALGNLQPRKNLGRLIAAYAALQKNHQIEHQLVIAGQTHWRSSELFRRVRAAGLEQDVLFTGYVDDTDLPGLYRGADCFVYPSLYEGFGLPVLEAMACGTPVVASNTASIPEVTGDAAVLVDPLDIGQIAEAIHQVLTITDLRHRLAAAGLKRAQAFSWDRLARQTLEVYQEVRRNCSTRSPRQRIGNE